VPVSSAVATDAHTVRVLQVTDPHLFAAADGSLRGAVTDRTLAAVLEHFAKSGWRADLVAATGDLIQDDTREAYRRFREHFEPVGLPVLCVPGNHDRRDLMREELAGGPFRYCAAIPAGDWLVLGIDSCKPGSAGGEVAEAELERMERELAATSARHVLACLHHPPLDVGSAWLDRVGLDNGDALIARLAADGRVRGCLFGHVHQAVDETVDGIRIIGTPSTCRQFLPGSEDFALDDRPPAYRRLELLPDGGIADELVWVTDAGEAARS